MGKKTMKEGGNITILLLGDEAVGKSSLASTFVSRHFSEQVPGILTRVRLPPDPSLSKYTTTIIDTQEGDKILSNALFSSGTNRESLESISSKNADSISSSGEPHATNMDSGGEASLKAGVSESRRCSSPTSSSGQYESAAAFLAATSPFRSVDTIILVYDLDRIETFHRLEHHWLPLIEQCYNGELPVIIAGNKMDLSSASDGKKSPTRQQIISLLQRFKFVRQCIKCSAKKLLNVDELFCKSQHSVLYPICPLYDLTMGKLTETCSRAFTRIFRMFDTDRDGLLSDMELNIFQQKIWGISLTEKDFSGWKKMVTQRHSSGGSESGVEEEDVIRDGKFTVAGFLAIFDVLITSQNRLEVPWGVLRTMGYDDALNLLIPASIFPRRENGLEFAYLHDDDWRLTSSDIDFLTSIFLQFDSDCDGALSSAEIHSIFSVLSSPQPPWCEPGLFRDCLSVPLIGNEESSPASPGATFDQDIGSSPTSRPSSPSSMISASGITISSSPLPSVDISKDSEFIRRKAVPELTPLSFLSWMNHWHMICTISPSIARAELYRLGHVFEPPPPRILHSMSRVGPAASRVTPMINMPSTFIRAIVLGSKDSGKRGLVQKLHRRHCSHGDMHEMEYPATSCSVSKTIQPDCAETIVHLILTEVPALDMSSDTEKRNLKNKVDILLGQETSGKRPYDMVLLVFDATNIQSLEFAKELERNVLTEEIPRVFVGTTNKAVGCRPCASNVAHEHCKCMDLEPPLIVSLGEETLDPSVLEHLVSCAQDGHQYAVSFRSTPHSERKRRDTKRRKVLWIGGLVTVVLGLTLTRKKKMVSASVTERVGWLRFFQKVFSI
mmetsp:Transcript_33057/g.69568  ORF Transcript_33057/g.69568 Transcript_33057/m.69568 type:complete len:839 (+) Transcript_33057:42-2558(+)